MKIGRIAVGSRGCRGRAGFSLIELLIVILVIGVMAAIAVPMIGRISNGGAGPVKDKRNAQMLASICHAGEVAGLTFVVPGDLAATIDNIVAGATVTEGSFSGNTFAVPGISEDDKVSAAEYLTLADGRLVFMADE